VHERAGFDVKQLYFSMKRLAFVFDNFGPYHESRVGAVAATGLWEVTGVELHPRSRTYDWEPGEGRTGAFRKISLPKVEWRGRAERQALRPHLERVLGECGPDVVFVNGWGDFLSLETMAWARRTGVRLVVMSETRRVDGARSWWGEWVKSRIVSLCDAGLCGGESHRRYLGELGLAQERVALGYNAVDNDFFAAAKKSGQQDDGRRNYREGSEAPEDREDDSTTKKHEKTRNGEKQGDAQGTCAGASETDSLTSKLADSPVSESLIRYADNPASSPATSYSLPPACGVRRLLHQAATAPEAPTPATSHSLLATAPEALPQPYFLASNRFVERKNLGRLIRAYARYCAGRAAEEIEDGRWKIGERGSEEKPESLKAESGKSPATSDSPLATSPIGEQRRGVWPMVLLGDGELRGDLEGLCGELGLRTERKFSHGGTEHTEGENLKLNSYKLKTSAEAGLVVFAGFRQVEELPFFYAGAGAFIHPALAEPWGLVINEAMASGLPILSSKNVGAAEELVQEGVNGFSFDPENVDELAALMGRVAAMSPEERVAMGEASRRLIAEWGPERFARGAEEAARLALAGPAKRADVFNQVLLEVLIRR